VLRTGQDYVESLRDGREMWIDGEQVEDVPTHPAFAPNGRRCVLRTWCSTSGPNGP
jgi:aromatic ring hydroxylase